LAPPRSAGRSADEPAAATLIALDGKPYHNDYVWIFRMRDDTAVEVQAFLDLVPYEDVLRRIPGKKAP